MANRGPVRPEQTPGELVERAVIEDAGGADSVDQLRGAAVPAPLGAQQQCRIDHLVGVAAVVMHEQLDRLPMASAPTGYLSRDQQPVQFFHRLGSPQLGQPVLEIMFVVPHPPEDANDTSFGRSQVAFAPGARGGVTRAW